MATWLQEELEKWKILKIFSCLCTDSTKNMIKIMEYLPATTVQCLCLNHKLNSAVNTKILEKPSVSKMSRELLTTVQVVISLLKT